MVPGGLDDRTYAPWGKPVEAVLRRGLARFPHQGAPAGVLLEAPAVAAPAQVTLGDDPHVADLGPHAEGAPQWRHIGPATLTMRDLPDAVAG